MKEQIIEKEELLLEFLLNRFNKLSRNSVKSLLSNKQIVINGKVVTKYNHLLKKGDLVSFSGLKNNNSIKVIYEDELFLVIDKPCNLLTVATNKENEKTAYVEASKYTRENNPKARIYVLHRLDRETSGVLAFCKNEKVKDALQDAWNDIVSKREYVAVVEGSLKKKEGTIKSYLKEGKNRVVYSTKESDGKLAITEYKVLKENAKYSMVHINLLTGRKNQIRVHFKDIGHPLVGDDKYGSTCNPIKRLCLHATKLELNYNGKNYCFETIVPANMKNLI